MKRRYFTSYLVSKYPAQGRASRHYQQLCDRSFLDAFVITYTYPSGRETWSPATSLFLAASDITQVRKGLDNEQEKSIDDGFGEGVKALLLEADVKEETQQEHA
jgi:hypothetical protein